MVSLAAIVIVPVGVVRASVFASAIALLLKKRSLTRPMSRSAVDLSASTWKTWGRWWAAPWIAAALSRLT